MLRRRVWRDTRRTHGPNHHHHNHNHNHHHHHNHHQAQTGLCDRFCCASPRMDEFSGQPMSAAQRRRQRRLRSMLRHEQQSIRMALATVMHHSYKVHTEYGAPRSQTTATRASEGEVHEQHVGLRAQKRPLPGTRPAPLSEVSEPQVGAVTVGYVAALVPLLSTPSLADTMADQVDDRAVDILQFALKKKEEVEERRRQEEVAEHERRMRVLDRRIAADEQLTPEESYAWRAWAGHLPGGKRKRKKRRKKKTPRASSHSSLRRAHRRQRQWYVLAGFAGYDTPLAVFPSIVDVRGDSTGAVLGHSDTRCCTVWCFWSDSAENCGLSAVAVSSLAVYIPFVPQTPIPMVLLVQITIETPQLMLDFRWSMFLLPGRADSQVLPWRSPWRSHSCSSSRNLRLSPTPCI